MDKLVVVFTWIGVPAGLLAILFGSLPLTIFSSVLLGAAVAIDFVHTLREYRK